MKCPHGFRIVVVLFALVGFLSWSQEFRSTIAGQITDAQEAAVPGAKMVVTEVDTGAQYQMVSAADGQYTLPFLAPGVYRVTAEARGFKRYVGEALRLVANERRRLDIKLEIGPPTESVTITAVGSVLETSTASVGQVIDTRQLDTLALNGRVALVALRLAANVMVNAPPQGIRPYDAAGPTGFSLGGAPNQANELLIDGAPNVADSIRSAYPPPMDAVQEVKVETFQVDAAYGHTGGGTANVILKSGTNSFHGVVYDFNKVSNLAATPYFVKRAGLPKPRL